MRFSIVICEKVYYQICVKQYKSYAMIGVLRLEYIKLEKYYLSEILKIMSFWKIKIFQNFYYNGRPTKVCKCLSLFLSKKD